MTNTIQFHKPQFRCSYRGAAFYYVGREVPTLGRPSVRCRYHLGHFELHDLNNPDQFWDYMIAEVGTVSWEYFPQRGCQRPDFPPESITKDFPHYVAGRWNEQQQFEVKESHPLLMADISGFRILKIYQEEKAIYPLFQNDPPPLWIGTAKEITKNLWFEKIFPHLFPSEQARIVQFLIKKEVELPPLPSLPDRPYSYYIGNNQWEIHLSRLLEPTQYLNKEGNWTPQPSQAERFFSEKSVQARVDLLKQ